MPQARNLTLYFAGPLFSDAERRFNELLASKLEQAGFRVFLPQRDGVESSRPPYDTLAPDQRRQALFAMDREHIAKADVFLFVLDGRVPDEGACVELGIAHGCKWLRQDPKLLVGLHTDVRAAFLGSKVNPLIRGALDVIVSTEGALLDLLLAHAAQGAASSPPP